MIKKILFFSLVFQTLYSHEYKAVFDCSSSDSKFIVSRMLLIEKTIKMIEDEGQKAVFAITLHGGCVAMTSAAYDEIVPDDEMIYIKKAQETIQNLATKKGVEIVACNMSLNANSIDSDDVLPFVKISKNSFLDTIKYQNLGYALMPLK